MPDFTPEKFLLFLAFVAPGFFAMQVYSLWYPTQKREWGSSLIEIVSYSLLTYLLWSRSIISHLRDAGVLTAEAAVTPGELLKNADLVFGGAIWVGIVTPAALASTLFLLRSKILPRFFGMDHPTRTAWDYAFRKNRRMIVICTFKSGDVVCGLYGGQSYSTTYPVEQELFLEQLWELEDGRAAREVEDSLGTVIKVAECKLIEFFSAGPECGPGRFRRSLASGSAWLRKRISNLKKGKCDVDAGR